MLTHVEKKNQPKNSCDSGHEYSAEIRTSDNHTPPANEWVVSLDVESDPVKVPQLDSVRRPFTMMESELL